MQHTLSAHNSSLVAAVQVKLLGSWLAVDLPVCLQAKPSSNVACTALQPWQCVVAGLCTPVASRLSPAADSQAANKGDVEHTWWVSHL
jgi:hypothetical protein